MVNVSILTKIMYTYVLLLFTITIVNGNRPGIVDGESRVLK